MAFEQCGTCAYWLRCEENMHLGVCKRMGVINFGANASVIMSNAFNPPTSDFKTVRTLKTFGCIFHSANRGMEICHT
jgi:hypothetical protein